MILKKEIVFFILVLLFGLAVSFLVPLTYLSDPVTLAIRLLALNGYIALSIAAIMTPFLKEITLFFRKPFTKVHHYFAAAGLTLITLHPLIVAIQTLNPIILLPNTGSLYLFFFFGGSIALIMIYVAVGAILLKRKITAYWRPFHALMYAALFFGVIHGNLQGFDLQNVAYKVIYDGLFVAAMAGFALKRWQFYQFRARMKKAAEVKRNGLN